MVPLATNGTIVVANGTIGKITNGTIGRTQNGATVKLEFMFMKHYAPHRCEPRIEVIVKMGVWPGDMNQEYIIVKMHKNGREGWSGSM